MERCYVEGLNLKRDQSIPGPVGGLAFHTSHERDGKEVMCFLLYTHSLFIGTWNTRPRGTQDQGLEAHAAEGVVAWGTDQREGALHLASDIVPLFLSFSRVFLKYMPTCDEIFKQLEDYDDITIESLAVTKIGKVLRHIELKDEIPRQEEFRFQERAKLLAERWSQLLKPGSGDYAKGSDFAESGSIDATSTVLHDAIRARRRYIGGVSGLKEVIVENAAGRVISVTIPYP